MLKPIAALVATASLVVAVPPYYVPPTVLKAALNSDDCILPEGFTVHNFQIWSPAESNNRSAIIRFGYSDESTNIETSCHYNSSSANVGPEGLDPRYACDNSIVEFMWQNGTLVLIEKACPETMTRGFEAAGTIKPDLSCGVTERNSTVGEGNGCLAVQNSITANFTSLSPTPK